MQCSTWSRASGRFSARFHREEDETARLNLEAMLNSLSPRQTTRIIRAFSYFSHLANIAEDLHHIRLHAGPYPGEAAPARLGTFAPRARPSTGGPSHHARPVACLFSPMP